MKKLTTTIALLSSITASSMMLSACHENPLKLHSERENVTALQEAARMVEKNLKLSSFKRGCTYLECMEGKQVDVNCEKFLGKMLKDLKTKQGYGAMNLSDLTDRKIFASLVDSYEEKIFNTID